jgi:hypothetical protein
MDDCLYDAVLLDTNASKCTKQQLPLLYGRADKLAVTGMPIWIAELDVSAADESVRVDDCAGATLERFLSVSLSLG